MTVTVGVDVGTQGSKAGVYTADGVRVGKAYAPHTIDYLGPGRAEMDIEHLVTAAFAAIAAALDDAVAAVDDINLLRETIDSVSATPLAREDVESTIVGVRPLVDDGSDTYTSSRRFDIRDHADGGLPGLYTVTGGK